MTRRASRPRRRQPRPTCAPRPASRRGVELCRLSEVIDSIGPVADVPAGSHAVQRGLLHMLAAADGGALARVRRGARDPRGRPGSSARVHLNRGNVYLQNGALAEAGATSQARAGPAGTPDGDPDVDKARHNLGYTDFLAGDLVAALRDVDEVEPRLVGPERPIRRPCEQDRAEVLMAAGLLTSRAQRAARRPRTPTDAGACQRPGRGGAGAGPDAAAAGPERCAHGRHARALRRFRRTGGEVWACAPTPRRSRPRCRVAAAARPLAGRARRELARRFGAEGLRSTTRRWRASLRCSRVRPPRASSREARGSA